MGTIVVVGTLVIATLLFLDKKKKKRKQEVIPRDQAHGPGHHYTANNSNPPSDGYDVPNMNGNDDEDKDDIYKSVYPCTLIF